MNRSPPDSPFDSSDNKIVSRLAPNRSPLDQWQSRSATPLQNNMNTHFYSSNDLRPILNNYHISPLIHPRVYTPRSSYFSPQHNIIFTTNSPQINHNINNSSQSYGNQSSNYDSIEAPLRQSINNHIRQVNQPVYMTPDGNINNINHNNIDINLLRSVLDNSSATNSIKDGSTQSTVSVSTDSTSNNMKKLIESMKTLTDEEHDHKKLRKEIDSKLSELDEQLKDYEQKIHLRIQLRKVKEDMNSKEEEFEKRRRELLSQMEKCSDSQEVVYNNFTNSPLKKSEVIEKTNEILKVDENKDCNAKVESTNERTAHKRPNVPSIKSTPVKKLKTNHEITSSLRKQVPKSGSKINENPLPKRPPLIRNPVPKTSDGQSPKINRLCRQQTPTVQPSGVKTSRPQRMMTSNRVKKPIVTDTHNPQQTSDSHKSDDSSQSSRNPIDSNDEEPSSSKPISDAESDSEVFEELSKSIPDKHSIPSNDSTPKMSADSIEDTQENIAKLESKQTHESTEEECVSNCNLNEQQMVDNIENSKVTDINVSNDLKANKDIEIVEIDDDNEDYVITPEEVVKIKEEKIDGESVPINEELQIELKKKVCEDSHLKTNTKDDEEVFKSPLNPPTRQRLKFYGIEPEECAPTVLYSITSFKAIAGPKSKTAKTTVIILKSFKNYLFATFTDCTVRRYNIADKKDVLRYEGHQHFVMTLTIARCLTNDDNSYLYTGCKDGMLRSFNVITGQLIRSLKLDDVIVCLDFCWNHIFAGLLNGNLCKIKLFHETSSESQNDNHFQKFSVNAGKRISAIKGINCDPPRTNCEAVLVVSNTKIRIVNTVSSLKDEERILVSINANFSLPIFMQIYEKHLFISYKVPPIKNEDKKKDEKSKVLIYDLQKDWKPIRDIDVNGIVTSLEVNGKDLIIACYSGQIRCVDCQRLEMKWMAYSSHITASVMIGDRLITGNEEGLIDVIYLDQRMIDCESCGVAYARKVDFKEHIKQEHPVSDDSTTQ